jgi:hypothetical protein
VYLVDPESGVHHSENLWDLLALYRSRRTAKK